MSCRNGEANTQDPNLLVTGWSRNQINIGQDYLDVRRQPMAGGSPQASPAAGCGATRSPRGAGWQGPVSLGGSLAAHLRVIRDKPGSGWGRPVNLGMGRLGGAPAATGLASGEADVFWPARSHASVWRLSYLPGRGGKAHDLAAGVSGGPVAVTAPATGVDVFWKGSNGKLWWAAGHGASWARPSQLGMGVLGSGPFAAGQPAGVINVFWKGATDAHLWQARYRNGAWSRAASLGGALG
jgi:hypothetical protein